MLVLFFVYLVLINADVSQRSAMSTVSSVLPGTIRPGHPRWVEMTFCKRECAHYIASVKNTTQCVCGQTWAYHKTRGIKSIGESNHVWSPSHHTTSSPTDAFGAIDFLGGPHPNKAQFIRLGCDSRPDLIFQLLTREWGLELPRLVISVHGGKTNFELSPRIQRVLRKGLLRAAKTTGTRLFSLQFAGSIMIECVYQLDRCLDFNGRNEYGRD